jgi:hypothetical protein
MLMSREESEQEEDANKYKVIQRVRAKAEGSKRVNVVQHASVMFSWGDLVAGRSRAAEKNLCQFPLLCNQPFYIINRMTCHHQCFCSKTLFSLAMSEYLEGRRALCRVRPGELCAICK